MVSKGEKLNQRVWALFEKAGFSTNPNSTDSSEYLIKRGKGRPLDLYAEDKVLKIKIIGSNKSGGLSTSWTAHMADCDSLKKEVGADKCLLVATDHELEQSDISYADSINLAVWTEENLLYFEELVDIIGIYAKYEIIHSLGIKTREESDVHRVLAIKLNQPAATGSAELYAFSMSPERLLRTSVIYRKAQGNAAAYQRMLNKARLPKIGDFLQKNDSILPTDIIVHLADDVTVQPIPLTDIVDSATGRPLHFSNTTNYCPVILGIPMKYASTEIIDGQHRLYGFTKIPQSIRDDFNLVIVGIKNLTDKQKRETFVAINDSSKRMDANLVAYLKYTNDATLCKNDPILMAIYIVVELNKYNPFKKIIRLLDTGKEKITLRGFSGYDLKGLIGLKGELRKYNPLNDPDEYVRMIRMYFSTFKTVFSTEWSNPEIYLVATNRGLTALLKLLKSILKHESGFPSPARFTEYVSALQANWSTWEMSKLQKTYVGSQGWKEFHRDLVKAIRKDSRFKNFKE